MVPGVSRSCRAASSRVGSEARGRWSIAPRVGLEARVQRQAARDLTGRLPRENDAYCAVTSSISFNSCNVPGIPTTEGATINC